MILPKMTVADYPEMLRKLSAANFVVLFFLGFVLGLYVPEVHAALVRLDDVVPKLGYLSGYGSSIGLALLAFLFALVFESIKLHDRISDVFKIRAEFDLRYIIFPMAVRCAQPMSSDQFRRLVESRKSLMAPIFYRYASSSAGQAVIDPHTITQALTAWSWYWVCAESIFIAIIFSVVALFFWQLGLCLTFLFVALGFRSLMVIFRSDVCKYAQSEVDQILSDNVRLREIADVFGAI